MENIPFRPKNDTFESLSDIISNHKIHIFALYLCQIKPFLNWEKIYTLAKKGINLLNLRYNLKTRIIVKAEGCC